MYHYRVSIVNWENMFYKTRDLKDDLIYLDHNATTPVDPLVAKAMMPFMEDEFGNPSSQYVLGTRSKEAVEQSRKEVASILGCSDEEIIFTSGGSESNNKV